MWHDLTLVPEMWREDFAAKARLEAKRERLRQQKKAQADRERQRREAEFKDEQQSATRAEVAALWKQLDDEKARVGAFQGAVDAYETDLPEARWFYAARRILDPTKLERRWAFWILELVVVAGGLWLWGALADSAAQATLFAVVVRVIVLLVLGVALALGFVIVAALALTALERTEMGHRVTVREAILDDARRDLAEAQESVEALQWEIQVRSRELG